MAKALYGYAGAGGSRHHISQPQTTPAKALCGTTLNVLVTAAQRNSVLPSWCIRCERKRAELEGAKHGTV
jgi:hypothetical protein